MNFSLSVLYWVFFHLCAKSILFFLQVFTYDPYDDSYQAVPINSYHTVYITPGAGPGV